MNAELLYALVVFAFVSSVTPGPNNLMLMASGANFGFARSIPHMLGIALGFTLMILCVGFGLIGLFDAFPVSYLILKVASVVYMSWLAFKIARAAPATPKDGGGAPMTFLQAAAFQWVNPKAWTMALTAVSVYSPSHSVVAIGFVAAVFGAINLHRISLWTSAGQQLAAVLQSPRRLRVFNRVMAVLLLASLYPVLLGEF